MVPHHADYWGKCVSSCFHRNRVINSYLKMSSMLYTRETRRTDGATILTHTCTMNQNNQFGENMVK